MKRILFIISFITSFLILPPFSALDSMVNESDDIIIEEGNTDSNNTGQKQIDKQQEASFVPQENLLDSQTLSQINSVRDPFYPILNQFGFNVSELSVEKYSIDELKLVGLVWGTDSPSSMFKAPNGQRFILKKGAKIGRNSGVIMDINKGQVEIKETYLDMSGNAVDKSIIKKVNKGV